LGARFMEVGRRGEIGGGFCDHDGSEGWV
jgi:hypothetical protein